MRRPSLNLDLNKQRETTREIPQIFFNNENIHIFKGGVNKAWKEF